jgi:hypothetical protein
VIGTISITEVLEMRSADSSSENPLPVAALLDHKRGNDTYLETLESVRRYGVQHPILIRYEELCNGHHRIAACVDLGIEQIDFTDDPEIGWAHEFEWPEESEAMNCE